jgi:Mlc titration factor MtfA (ptsG expression regulator)
MKEKYPSGRFPPDVKKKMDRLESNLRFERWSVSSRYGIRATISHEFAHTLSDQYFGMINGTLANPNANNSACYNARKLIEDTRKKAWDNGDIYSISKYGATDDDEFFAEVFAMKEMGEQLPDYISDMLKEVLKNGIM